MLYTTLILFDGACDTLYNDTRGGIPTPTHQQLESTFLYDTLGALDSAAGWKTCSIHHQFPTLLKFAITALCVLREMINVSHEQRRYTSTSFEIPCFFTFLLGLNCSLFTARDTEMGTCLSGGLALLEVEGPHLSLYLLREPGTPPCPDSGTVLGTRAVNCLGSVS